MASIKRMVGWALCVFMIAAPVAAYAQDDAKEPPRATNILEQTMNDARAAYNAEKYKKAIELYTRAAQIDPGAQELKGAPYRNLARCHYWLGNYDSSTFWYNVYLKSWPKAKDHDDVESERNNTNDKRSDPSASIKDDIVYDRTMRELADSIRDRIAKKSEAVNARGGGTASLYSLAIKRGYAMPELAEWSTALRAGLIGELKARWTHAESSPLPLVGPESEPIKISEQRLKMLDSMAPSSKEQKTHKAFVLLLSAWKQYLSEDYTQAADAFAKAAAAQPELPYLAYARALAQLKAGEASAANATLNAATAGAPKSHKVYYKLLRAEALRAMDKHTEAATIYMDVLR